MYLVPAEDRWTHCDPVKPYGKIDVGQYWLKLTDGTKPLPKPMLTNHQWAIVAYESNFPENAHDIYPSHEFKDNLFKITAASSRANEFT